MEENEKPYNRIVLIGNGFDKALGLKTGYTEFIYDYIKKVVIESLNNQDVSHNADLLRIVKGGAFNVEYINAFIKEHDKESNLRGLLEDLKKMYDIQYSYKFFEDIIRRINGDRWVDIEQEYFNYLIGKFNYSKKHGLNEYIDLISRLNACMDILTDLLKNFISEQQRCVNIGFIAEQMDSLFEKINNPLEIKRASFVSKHCRTNKPQKVIFINFNYTNTVLKIINSLPFRESSIHISIHGNVSNPDNPIIFGYGDDTGDDYKALELDNKNELLRKIKSFQYPRTNNYHRLLNFIDGEEFDVFIIGHSCGISDRTLLKTIFEHDNCLAIQNFHYKGEPEDFEKRMEISRHFSDKIMMRLRVLPFDELARIPQLS